MGITPAAPSESNQLNPKHVRFAHETAQRHSVLTDRMHARRRRAQAGGGTRLLAEEVVALRRDELRLAEDRCAVLRPPPDEQHVPRHRAVHERAGRIAEEPVDGQA